MSMVYKWNFLTYNLTAVPSHGVSVPFRSSGLDGMPNWIDLVPEHFYFTLQDLNTG